MKGASVMSWAPVSAQTQSRTAQYLILQISGSGLIPAVQVLSELQPHQELHRWGEQDFEEAEWVSVFYTECIRAEIWTPVPELSPTVPHMSFPWGPERPNKSPSLVPPQAPLENHGTLYWCSPVPAWPLLHSVQVTCSSLTAMVLVHLTQGWVLTWSLPFDIYAKHKT